MTSPDSAADLASRLRRGVLMASRRLRSERSADLSEGQYSVLVLLEARGPGTPSELAAIECVSGPSMTRTIACLAEEGLVVRTAHPTDGRVVVVDLADAGREALRATRQRRDAWLARRLGDLDAGELETLSRAADILRRISTQ